MEANAFPCTPKTQAHPGWAIQPTLQPVIPTVSSTGRSPHLQESSELQLITRMGPRTKNRTHQETFPLYRIVSSSLDDAVGRGAQCTTHETMPEPSSPTANPPNPHQPESHQSHHAGPRRSAPLPARGAPCSFPSSRSSGELLAFPFRWQVIYGAIQRRQLTDIRRV